MTRAVVLEDFDSAAAAPAADLEEERLKAFENGYGAGWEDAARAHAEEQERISAEFGRSLQELSFTFHEAQTALLREVEGVIAGLVETVLPAALHAALAGMIRERAAKAAQASSVTVEIVVAPENVARVEALAEGRPAPPLRIVGEPSLGSGQACLRFGASEERIDLDATLAELREAVARFVEGGGDAQEGSAAGADPAGDGASGEGDLPGFGEARHA